VSAEQQHQQADGEAIIKGLIGDMDTEEDDDAN
jgi:hypothetical protein